MTADVGEELVEEAEENDKEGVDLVLLVLLALIRSRGRPEIVRARVGREDEGRNLGTAGKASKMGVTRGGESQEGSEADIDAVERRGLFRTSVNWAADL